MYLVGASHPNKDRLLDILMPLVQSGERFITDVEVYQEVLHRYTAIRRLDATDSAFASLDAIVDDVLTFEMSEIHAAREIVRTVDGISARDAIHVAVMRKAGMNRILSFDRGFDLCQGIDRLF